MNYLETLVFLLCSTLPIHWLAYYPFLNMLRFSKSKTMGLLVVSISMKTVLNYLALSHGINPYLVEYLFAPIHMVIYLVNIRVQPFKLVFTYLLIMDYLIVIKGISVFIVVGILDTPSGSWEESVICLLLFALTLPLMIRFFQKASRQVYRISAPIWNSIWVVPAFINSVVLLFTRNFTTENVRHWSFLFTRLGLLVCIFVIYYILLQSLEHFQKQIILETQKNQIEQVLSLQKEQYALLQKQNEETHRFRHDLRQHLVIVKHYLDEGQTEKLSPYLDIILGNLPSVMDCICPNDAVNAVALYYQAAAKQSGISSVSLKLEQFPTNCSQELDSDLCVLIGNLLENAVTACKGAKQPFIQMNSRFKDNILTITMDNRFVTVNQTADGDFLSTKTGGGIGLLSIRSITEKYHGVSRFEAQNTIFSSSIYLRISC